MVCAGAGGERHSGMKVPCTVAPSKGPNHPTGAWEGLGVGRKVCISGLGCLLRRE